jgi:trigger factor
MQVSIENSGVLERRMSVALDEPMVAEKIKERLQQIGRSARIDGFRPGKAPAKVIERQFGPRVRNEVLGELLRSSFSEALQEHQLRPVADPVFDPVDAEPGSGLSYTATFEVYPAITLNPVEQLALKRPVCEIGAADVDRMIDVLRQQHATWTPVERAAADGDQLILDFKGRLDGAEFERGSATDFELVLGAGRMIEGFEAGLAGAMAGDGRTLSLTFPADYPAAELATKPVEFDVTVKTVSERVLPGLDDSFFEKFGITEGGLEVFRKEVEENMQRERDRALQRSFATHVMAELKSANNIELPKAMVQNEALRMQMEGKRNLMMRGMDVESMPLPGPEVFEPQAQERVKLGLLMAEIIKTAGVTAQPAKVRAMVESMAAGYEQPEEMVKWYYSDPRRLQEIEAMCLEEEAVGWIVSKASVMDESISFDDLMNPRQTAARDRAQA